MTTGLAGRTTISCGGSGESSSRAAELSREASQACHASRPARTPGMRSWIGRASSLAAQVMIVQSGPRHRRARSSSSRGRRSKKGSLSAREKCSGPFRLAGILGPLPLVPAVGQDQAAVARPRNQAAVGRPLVERLGARVDHRKARIELLGRMAHLPAAGSQHHGGTLSSGCLLLPPSPARSARAQYSAGTDSGWARSSAALAVLLEQASA